MASNGKDIFGYRRNPKPAGAFSTEDSLLTFGSVVNGDDDADPNAALGLLVQNWNVSYAQQVQEIFELGSNRLYWSKGRPQGSGALLRVVGFQPASVNSGGNTGNQVSLFPPSAYDICKGGARFKLQAKGGNCDYVEGDQLDFNKTYGVGVVMDGCLVTSIGYSANVQDTRLMENITWRFAYMEVTTEA
jgi:hypothetical protein